MTRTINVLAEDIARGKQSDCERCPIALALARDLPPLESPNVWGTDGRYGTLLSSRDHVLLDTSLPAACHEFVTRFDAGLHVSPFSFDVELPDDAANYLKLN